MPKPKPESNYVTVEIYDQAYHLSGQDLPQMQRLAARVDERMRAVAAHGRTADSLRVAVLAALNLADELARAEERLKTLEAQEGNQQAEAQLAADSAQIRARAHNLSGLLDAVLEEARKTGS